MSPNARDKLKISIFSLLVVSLLILSCNGQVSTNQTTDSKSSIPAKEQHPRIIRTLGARFENVGSQVVDRSGNVWFSNSGEGAYRYDGKTFTTFSQYDH
jgi:hypothetical protein